MKCWVCHAEVSDSESLCPECGAAVQEPREKSNTTPAVFVPKPQPKASQGDATGGVIPYKNRKALIAYYLGVFSAIPILEVSCPMGSIAFVLGILGLRDRKRNPVIKGSLHALVGILGGGGFAILWGYYLLKKYLPG